MRIPETDEGALLSFFTRWVASPNVQSIFASYEAPVVMRNAMAIESMMLRIYID